jgi:hypothetical protein
MSQDARGCDVVSCLLKPLSCILMHTNRYYTYKRLYMFWSARKTMILDSTKPS